MYERFLTQMTSKDGDHSDIRRVRDDFCVNGWFYLVKLSQSIVQILLVDDQREVSTIVKVKAFNQ